MCECVSPAPTPIAPCHAWGGGGENCTDFLRLMTEGHWMKVCPVLLSQTLTHINLFKFFLSPVRKRDELIQA